MFAAALLLGTLTALKPPREAGLEELLETAETWVLDYDADDDDKLSPDEMEPLLEQIKLGSSMDSNDPRFNQLTTTMLMAQTDADGDGKADRVELADMLKRMKGYDGGHLKREDAAKPSGDKTGDVGWAKTHDERMRKKRKKKRKKKAAPAKDEA